MNDVNLDDLKIDHKKVEQKKGFPWITMVFIFLLGSLCGICLLYFIPTLIPGLMEKEPASATQNVEPVQNPETGGDLVGDTQEPVEKASFTEGGWIEVPSYHPVVVSALISGRLDELRVLEGSAVKTGDIIALLYTRDLEDAQAQSKAELRGAEAELARLKAGFRVQEVEKARADLEAAEADLVLKGEILERTKALVETGAESFEAMDRDQAAFQVAVAKKNILLQELLLKEEGYRKEDIDAAEAALAKKKAHCDLVCNQLEYATIRSPIDGVVLEQFVTPGTYIPAGNPRIVSLYDPNDLQVRVDVRQENIGGVFLGQKVMVATEAEPGRSYEGKVIRIDPKADFKKNTIQVKIKISDPSENLHPEMIARIQFSGKDND